MRKKFYIGTSGWMYDWNPDGFDWFIKHSGLDTVELNASFYRFPYPNQVKSWFRKTKNLDFRWSIKIHMSISHRRLLSNEALAIWDKFYNLFKPLDSKISFYLLQMPPRFIRSERNMSKIRMFVEYTGLGYRLAIEFRHPSWFNRGAVDYIRRLEVTYVSVDSPDTYFIAASGPYAYLRMHGRTFWYAHNYTYDELAEVVRDLSNLDVDEVYVYFNNNHDMLNNARLMKDIISRNLT